MSRINIKHFGPIESGCLASEGWIEIKKATVFIGNQGSGKSSVAKLISAFMWMEKVLTRGDYQPAQFNADYFKNTICRYHRIHNYFQSQRTEIIYEGDAYKFTYSPSDTLHIEKVEGSSYALPQIMYVPAERNFLSIIDKPGLIKQLPDSLVTFLDEYTNAKENIAEGYTLPVNNAQLVYNKSLDAVFIKGVSTNEDYSIKLSEASSGFQSLVPLLLVSDYLSGAINKQSEDAGKMNIDEEKRFREQVQSIYANNDLTDAQRQIALSALSSKFNKSAFNNIVEEPEQNLFPTSQIEILQKLLLINNTQQSNKLILTTHSPYIVNELTMAVKAGMLKQAIEKYNGFIDQHSISELDTIYPLASAILPEDVVIYELDELAGKITKLDDYNGIPSDKNYLNSMFDENNNTFSDLLDFQQKYKIR